jgi:hypothetical protein
MSAVAEPDPAWSETNDPRSSPRRQRARRARLVGAGIVLFLLFDGCMSVIGRPLSLSSKLRRTFGSCSAQEARPGVIASCCPFGAFFAWNGERCVKQRCSCGCEGGDCGDTFETLEECDRAFAHCRP